MLFTVSYSNQFQELVIDAAFDQRSEMTVRGCKRVSVQQGSFRNLSNVSLILSDIRDIRLVHGSFQRNIHNDISINITILGSTTREIPQGVFSISRSQNTPQPDTMPLLALQIVNSEVGKIAHGALGNFTVKSLSFVNSTFDLLETGAVDNNFIGTISLVNNTFHQLGHQALILHNASHSTNLKLKGNLFKGDY